MTSPSPELQVRRRRIARIRRRVIGGVCGLFAAATAAIAVQMATGHDPALAKSSRAGGSADGRSAAAGGGTGSDGGGWNGDGVGSNDDGGGWSGGGDGGSAPSTGSSSGGVAPLTTGQS